MGLKKARRREQPEKHGDMFEDRRGVSGRVVRVRAVGIGKKGREQGLQFF